MELGIRNAVDFLVLLQRFFRQLDGFVQVGDIEIRIGDIINQSQACIGHVFMRGLVFPYLRIGSGTEFAPQIQFVAQTKLAAEGIAMAAGFQVFRSVRAQRSAERRHQIRAQNIGLIQSFVDADGGLFQIDIVRQRLLHQRIELLALVDFPPVAVYIVAFGSFRRAHDLAGRFQRQVRIGFRRGART